jgi:hypothetical protein
MLFHSILSNRHILLHFLLKRYLLFLKAKLRTLISNILIFNLDHILFILINNVEQLSLNLSIMLSNLILIQENHLLFEYEI